MTGKNGTGKKLSPRQQDGLSAMLKCGSVSSASKSAGIPQRTLYRWMDLPHFADELAELHTGTLKAVSSALSRNGEQAVSVLVSEMNNSDGSAQSRIRSAVAVLDSLRSFTTLTSLDERLRNIEENLNL